MTTPNEDLEWALGKLDPEEQRRLIRQLDEED